MPVNILNLPGLDVVDFRETATEYHVRAKPKAISRLCPGCGSSRKAFVHQQKTCLKAGCRASWWITMHGMTTLATSRRRTSSQEPWNQPRGVRQACHLHLVGVAMERRSSCNHACSVIYTKHISRKECIVSNLLLKFKAKDTPYGVTRETLKAIAEEMDVSETMAIHLALSRLAKDVLPAYEMDDGPLSKSDLDHIRKVAQPMLAKGKVLSTRSLL